MAQLRNVNTGMVVDVADEKVERFNSDWVPVDEPPAKKTAAKKTPAKKAASKK